MQEPEQRSWWSRNWKWVVPVGCLGSLALMIASCAGVAAIIFGSLRYSWAYTEGVNLARNNKQVVAALGEPIKPGWLVSGSINISGSSGEANLAIPLSGPASTGTLYVVAHKRAGEWKFERAEVELSAQKPRIDLLTATDNKGVKPGE